MSDSQIMVTVYILLAILFYCTASIIYHSVQVVKNLKEARRIAEALRNPVNLETAKDN